MVQDVSLDGADDDDRVIMSPASSTPGLSPFDPENNGDYFSSAPQKRSSFRQGSLSHTSRRYSGSVMTRKDSGTPHRRQRRKPLVRLHTEVLLKMVLQDAQTRLVFRAQALIQADVQYYAAKEGDLDYPDKLGTGKPDSKAVFAGKEDRLTVCFRDGGQSTCRKAGERNLIEWRR